MVFAIADWSHARRFLARPCCIFGCSCALASQILCAEIARDAKLALSDSMHEYAQTRAGVTQPAKRRYFEQFDASVTVYPTLMRGSQMCAGNYKAWVRSFPDTLQSLNFRPLPLQTTWGIGEWRRFATDCLGLVPASLSEAVDPAVFRADQLVAEYAARLQRSTVPYSQKYAAPSRCFRGESHYLHPVSRNVGRFGCIVHREVHFWVHKSSRTRTFSTTYSP